MKESASAFRPSRSSENLDQSRGMIKNIGMGMVTAGIGTATDLKVTKEDIATSRKSNEALQLDELVGTLREIVKNFRQKLF